MSQKTVAINGKLYDAVTGLPVTATPSEGASHSSSIPRHPATPDSQTVHQSAQKSHTLNRHAVKKATPTGKRMDVARSPRITRFAPHPVAVTPQEKPADLAPTQHPLAAKAIAKQRARTAATAPKPSQVIKEEAAKEALESAPSHGANHQQVEKPRRGGRVLSVISATLALLLLGGYFTYLNMPSLSVRVAAAQAGVNASYPEYRPDGYSLRGPVGYGQGQVIMKFAANGGPQGFTITQSKSSWDSTAVLDNYVKEKAGENYIAYSENGLTIYTFDGNAAWVNGGVLYTVAGDAPLSGDQIRRLATSM